MQSTGASVEFGNIQGAVFNVITKQGGARYQYDASYYGQSSGLTARPVVLAASNGVSSGYERDQISRLHDQSRRSNPAGSPVVFRRLSVPSRLRQSARDGPGLSQKVRTEQDLREAHVEAHAISAADGELSRGDLGQSGCADDHDAVRGDSARARVGPQHDVRESHAGAVGQDGVGRTRRAIQRGPDERSQFRRPHDPVPSRSDHEHHERERSPNRRPDDRPPHGEGCPPPL